MIQTHQATNDLKVETAVIDFFGENFFLFNCTYFEK